jgi:hypothetical protein
MSNRSPSACRNFPETLVALPIDSARFTWRRTTSTVVSRDASGTTQCWTVPEQSRDRWESTRTGARRAALDRWPHKSKVRMRTWEHSNSIDCASISRSRSAHAFVSITSDIATTEKVTASVGDDNTGSSNTNDKCTRKIGALRRARSNRAHLAPTPCNMSARDRPWRSCMRHAWRQRTASSVAATNSSLHVRTRSQMCVFDLNRRIVIDAHRCAAASHWASRTSHRGSLCRAHDSAL